MKTQFVLWIFMVSALYASSALAATTLEKLTLQPGESKLFTIEAQEKTKIGFAPNLTTEQARQCLNNCIQISQVGGTTMSSMYGATLGMQPIDGKIEVALKNVEAFAIEVELFKK